MSSQENNFVQITKSIFFIVCAYHLDIVTYVSFKFLAGLAHQWPLLEEGNAQGARLSQNKHPRPMCLFWETLTQGHLFISRTPHSLSMIQRNKSTNKKHHFLFIDT
jgi:hypothetical protein